VIARWTGMRLWVAALIALAALLAGVFTAVQIRATQAEERRVADAEQVALEAEAEAEAQALLVVEREELQEAWTEAAAEATAGATEAEALLADSEGEVSDDAVRVALADALTAAQAALAVGPDPTAGELSTLRRAVVVLAETTSAVREAHSAWEQEQIAASQEPAAPPPAAARPTGGAAADCGGPESYEPPSGSGPVFYTSTPTESGDGTNGRIPRSQMAALSWCVDAVGNAQWLRADAAAALVRLNEAFRAQFGENIAVDMSYRSYEDQVAMREAYGSIAARPGTSNHGLGTAFDTWEWRAYSFGSARYEWLVTNGPEHGWVAPSWARQGGSNPEYWHFEYTG